MRLKRFLLIQLIIIIIITSIGGTNIFALVLPSAPSPSSPSGTINTVTPRLNWGTVQGVDKYGLYISVYPYGEANIVYQNENVNGSYYYLDIPSGYLQQGKSYRWNMRAHNSAGWSSYSSTLKFQVNNPQVQGKPDLVGSGLIITPDAVKPGDTVNVSYTVSNKGNGNAGASTARIRINKTSDNVTMSDTVLSEFTTPALMAGTSTKQNLNVIVPGGLSAGTYYIWVILDVNHSIGQSNEDNDRMTVMLKVDLEEVDKTNQDDQQVIEPDNGQAEDSDEGQIEDTDEGQTEDSIEETDEEQTEDSIEETDEEQTEDSIEETIEEQTEDYILDIILDNLKVSPSSVFAGNTVKLDVGIYNNSSIDANDLTVSVKINKSPDSFTDTDTVLATDNLPVIESQLSYDKSVSFKLPQNLMPGKYYIWVFIDSQAEENASISWLSTEITVSPVNKIQQIKSTDVPWGTAKWNNGSASGQVNNTGIYKFSLTAKGVLVVNATGNGSIKMSLFDSAKNVNIKNFGIITSKNSINENIPLPTGKYHIQVTGSGNCTITTEFETQQLTKTSWNQYSIFFNNKKDNPLDANILESAPGKDKYLTGCTAVAVGQLINYYLSNGYYEKGWLNVMLKNVKVWPRFTSNSKDEGTPKVYIHKGFYNIKSYVNFINEKDFKEPDAVKLQKYLFNVAVGLDAKFVKNSTTGVGEYLDDKDAQSDVKKIARLLESRFGFKKVVLNNKNDGWVDRIDIEKDYIIKSLNEGNPVLLSMYHNEKNDKNNVGHTAIIDSYKICSNGEFKVRINYGWANVKKTNDGWNPSNGGFYEACHANILWNKFFVYKNTIPHL